MRPPISEEDIQKQSSPQAASAADMQNGRISVEEFIDRFWDLMNGDPAGHRAFKNIELLTDENVVAVVESADPSIRAYYGRLLSLCYYLAAKAVGETGGVPREYLQRAFQSAAHSDAEQWWVDYTEAMAAHAQEDADWFRQVYDRSSADHPRLRHIHWMRDDLFK